MTPEEEKIAEELQKRGYEGIVPLHTAWLIESILDAQAPSKEKV